MFTNNKHFQPQSEAADDQRHMIKTEFSSPLCPLHSDLRPSHLGLQLGARMRRHADSISKWNNLFTNLADTGRLGVD